VIADKVTLEEDVRAGVEFDASWLEGAGKWWGRLGLLGLTPCDDGFGRVEYREALLLKEGNKELPFHREWIE
jgi:hypothetical protein